MGKLSKLFYTSDPNTRTLYRRVVPNQKQLQNMQEHWHDLKDAIVPELAAKLRLSILTWIQGSYKYGTIIKPVTKKDECDIDLGFYAVWDGNGTEIIEPKELKNNIQECLVDFSNKYPSTVEEVIAPPKERCARIRYNENFHIDTPGYLLNEKTNTRLLATENHGWEDSDPRELYIWFRDAVEEQLKPILKRLICYVKAWTALKYRESTSSPPSSIFLTILITELFKNLEIDVSLDDEDGFAVIVNLMHHRLCNNQDLVNPVNPKENLNRLSDEDFTIFMELLKSCADKSKMAVQNQNPIVSANLWEEIFEHLLPIPYSEFQSQNAASRLPVPYLSPNVRVTIKSQETGHTIKTDLNKADAVAKECDIFFDIKQEDHANIPFDATIDWMVRNNSDEAENANDLGHSCSTENNGRQLSSNEKSAYTGTHYMDLTIKRNGNIIGFRRIPIIITKYALPKRNPKIKLPYYRKKH